MTQKIEGKFYPLQHDEWVRACQELTPAQRDVLYFIRTLDPYNNGLDINTAEIARQLSTETKKVHRQTVSRALKELDSRGFIDLELLMVKVAVKPKGVWCDETPGCDETPKVPGDTHADHHAPTRITTHPARSSHTQQEPQVLPDKDSSSLRLNKTYLDFKDSLSEGEREKFLEFGLKKAAELPKPPTLPQKWIEKHYLEIYEEFKKTPEGKEFVTTQDWANHPNRDEWIEQIRQGKPRFIAQGGPAQERETRRFFADWAETNNLVWGVES